MWILPVVRITNDNQVWIYRRKDLYKTFRKKTKEEKTFSEIYESKRRACR